jgi:hypothetical protein
MKESAVDRLIKSKTFQEKLKIVITYVEGESVKDVSIWFLHFTPSPDVMVPFNKILGIQGVTELTGEYKPPNNKTVFLPDEGFSALEIAMALKEDWEAMNFDVEVKPEH